jgi:hypothetical protein
MKPIHLPGCILEKKKYVYFWGNAELAIAQTAKAGSVYQAKYRALWARNFLHLISALLYWFMLFLENNN